MGQASLNSYIFKELIFQDLELSEVWSYSQVQWVGQIDELQLVKILLEEHTQKKKKNKTKLEQLSSEPLYWNLKGELYD